MAVRALLANEAGGGRGHVTTLAAVGRALGAEVETVGALGRLTYSAELHGICRSVVKSPLLTRPPSQPQAFALRGSATFGDTLAEIGLDDPDLVRRGLDFWRGVIVDEDISLIVADLAPLALHAARGLRDEGWAIRIVTIGTGYYAPPATLETFPLFLPDHDRITRSEAHTLAVINAVASETGISALPSLPALYRADLALATTFAFLDPYAGTRPDHARIAPLVPSSRTLAGAGDEVFVYFSTGELRDEALVRALERLPLPRRGFLPSAPPEVKALLQSSGVILLDRPATADEIAARSRLIIHAAPHGTVCLAALAGLPQFGVPQHMEQLYNARACETLGILTHGLPGSADLGERIAAAYADRKMAAKARAVALDLRRDHPADPIAALSQRLAPILADVQADLG